MLAQNDNSTVAFLTHILPTTDFYVGWAKKGEAFRQKPFDSLDKLVAWLVQHDRQGFDVYHACSTFKARKGIFFEGKNGEPGKWKLRCHANVAAVRALWLDIDTQLSKDDARYADIDEAHAAVDAFCAATGMPDPFRVASGGGLHCYWPLAESLTLKEWECYAVALKRLCERHGLAADPSRTADASSVLRPVGMTHHKSGWKVACDPPAGPWRIEDLHLAPVESAPAGPTTDTARPASLAAAMITDASDKAVAPAETPYNIALLCTALAFVDPSDYWGNPEKYPGVDPLLVIGWFQSLCAIKSTGWKQEIQELIAVAYSQRTTRDNYSGDDEVRRKLAENIDGGREGVTERSVFKLAHAVGWDGWPLPSILEALTAALSATPQSSAVPPGEGSAGAGSITLEDFYAYLPTHEYVHVPTRAMWPAASVNAKIAPVLKGAKQKKAKPESEQDCKPETISASVWLDRHRSVAQMTWSPGEPLLIHDRFIAEGGWFPHAGAKVINTYRPPAVVPGDASQVEPWIDHVRFVFGEYAEHIILYLAQRVQRPWEKINHALVFGGAPGIGKDAILYPVRHAVGPWNFQEASPKQILGRFNGFLKCVVLRINEARDLGEVNQFAFYDATKTITAAPPEVHRIDEKHLREHSILNVNGTIISTNYKHGLYLPANDRRHYVAWSEQTMAAFDEAYWQGLFGWYDNGGTGHVAAYLARLDISQFDPAAPPAKTPAFWAVVDTHRAAENSELNDVIDAMERPPAVTITELRKNATAAKNHDLNMWLDDRKNRKKIPHRMEECGYVPVRNPDANDGLWKIGDRRQAVYARADLSPKNQMTEAAKLAPEVSTKPAAG